MDIKLIRHTKNRWGTFGKMIIDGVEFCDTIEPISREKLNAQTLTLDGKEINNKGAVVCIPEGRYKITICPSPRYGRNMPRLQRVPGRSGILIHTGNFVRDTRGCILVGKATSTGFMVIGESQKTFNILFDKLLTEIEIHKEDVWIEIV